MSNTSNPRPAWYDYVLAIIPLILVLVWGNSVYLCTIIPIVGGALGGAISGLCCGISLMLMAKQENFTIKIVIAVVNLIVSFGACALVGLLIIGALA